MEAASLGLFAGLPLIVSMPGDLLGGVVTDRLAARYGLRVGRCGLGAVSYLLAGIALLFAARTSSPMAAAVLIAVSTGMTKFTLGAACWLLVDPERPVFDEGLALGREHRADAAAIELTGGRR